MHACDHGLRTRSPHGNRSDEDTDRPQPAKGRWAMTALMNDAGPSLTEEVVPEDTKRAARSRSLLVLPSLVWWALFFLVPLGVLVVYSFGQLDIITFTMSWGWTLANYPRIIEAL